MKTPRKFYKTIYRIEVLSEEPVGETDLDTIEHLITDGPCSGLLHLESEHEVSGPDMVQLLYAQGSEPGFFRLSEEGEDI